MLTPGQPIAAVLQRGDIPPGTRLVDIVRRMPRLGFRLVTSRDGLCLYRLH